MWTDDVKAFSEQFSRSEDQDWQETLQLKKDIKEHLSRDACAGLSLELFTRIASWKLGRQEGRTRRFRSKLTDDFVDTITSCAFALEHPDRETLTRGRLNVLQGLSGVGIGIASAILALTLPDQYGVIDNRVWKVVYDEDRETFSLSDYHRYLADLLAGAEQLNWPPQELDFLAWKMSER